MITNYKFRLKFYSINFFYDEKMSVVMKIKPINQIIVLYKSDAKLYLNKLIGHCKSNVKITINQMSLNF